MFKSPRSLAVCMIAFSFHIIGTPSSLFCFASWALSMCFMGWVGTDGSIHITKSMYTYIAMGKWNKKWQEEYNYSLCAAKTVLNPPRSPRYSSTHHPRPPPRSPRQRTGSSTSAHHHHHHRPSVASARPPPASSTSSPPYPRPPPRLRLRPHRHHRRPSARPPQAARAPKSRARHPPRPQS